MQKLHIAKLMFALLVLTVIAMPAFALGVNPLHRGAPGPLLGAGLPLLALAAGGYFVARRRRQGS